MSCGKWRPFCLGHNVLILFNRHPDSKVHGANMGPTWVLSAPDGPHVGPMNLAIRVCSSECEDKFNLYPNIRVYRPGADYDMFVGVTPSVCKSLCLKTPDLACNSLLYIQDSKTCKISPISSKVDNVTLEEFPGVDYYERIRCESKCLFLTLAGSGAGWRNPQIYRGVLGVESEKDLNDWLAIHRRNVKRHDFWDVHQLFRTT